MTLLSDAIVIDTAELRTAAASLREAERGMMELGLRLPREVWGAPDWLASGAADELGLTRRQLDELGADIRAEAVRLEARADEVDGAEQRWWSIAGGACQCGCVLPSGTVVAQPGSFTAVSSASGPGVGDGSVAIDVGAIGVAAAAGYSVSVIGGAGDSLFGGSTVGQPASTAPIDGSGYSVSVIGGAGDSLFGGSTVGQPASTAPNDGSGYSVSVIGGAAYLAGSNAIFDPAFDAAATAAMDAQFASIGLGGGGVGGTQLGTAYLPAASLFPDTGPALIAGGSLGSYSYASGSTYLGNTWDHPGEGTSLVL